MKVGYVPNNLTQTLECEVFMLPGLTAKFDGCRIAGLTISRITLNEFRLLEKSQFANDLQGKFVLGRGPLYCVFSSFTDDEESRRLRSEGRALATLRLARSLWLLKEGFLGNPLQFVCYQRVQSDNRRNPGIFGRLAYELRSYELTVDELPVLEGIYYAVASFDEGRMLPAVDVAERLFMETYSPAAANKNKMLYLLGSLEALTSGVAFELQRASWLTAEQELFLTEFRRVRNGIAHGSRSGSIDQLTALRGLVRCLLREAILWAVEDPAQKKVTGNGLISRLSQLNQCGPQRLADAQVPYPALLDPDAADTERTAGSE